MSIVVKAAATIYDPQSFNRYSYVTNDPLNFVDPKGLYEACIHEAMTKFIGKLAGVDPNKLDKIAAYTGDGPGGADSKEHAATSPKNWIKCRFGRGDSVRIHFPSDAQLKYWQDNYAGFEDSDNLQQAGFAIHSIEDGLGAHKGYWNIYCLGHLTDIVRGMNPHQTDRRIGDSNFIGAANKVYQVMKRDPNARLTDQQMRDLIKYILEQCSNKGYTIVVGNPGEGGGGGPGPADGGGRVLSVYTGPGPSAMDILWWLYNQWLDAMAAENQHLG